MTQNAIVMNSSRRSEIAELAEAIAEEFFPTDKVDCDWIAAYKNISISYGQYENAFDGLLEHKTGRFHIYCNLDRLEHPARPRARFTLAHELGHYFIDEHRNALASGKVPGTPCFSEYESNNLAEQEADNFASNLLMPARRFVRMANSTKNGLSGILKLADTFGTSVTSTAIRYAVLEIKPCLVIKWSTNKYQWKWLSTNARLANYRRTIESISNMVPESATSRALAGEQVPTCGFFELATTASAWFPFIPVWE